MSEFDNTPYEAEVKERWGDSDAHQECRNCGQMRLQLPTREFLRRAQAIAENHR